MRRQRAVQANGEPGGRTVVFFGGSFTFGEGVGDDKTLPYYFAQHHPGARVLNRAFPGHGPAQMLQQLDTDPTFQQLDGEVWAMYVFIPGYLRGAIGSMRVAAAWGRDFPNYALGENGAVELNGTFASGRPALSLLYGVLSRESVLRHFNGRRT